MGRYSSWIFLVSHCITRYYVHSCKCSSSLEPQALCAVWFSLLWLLLASTVCARARVVFVLFFVFVFFVILKLIDTYKIITQKNWHVLCLCDHCMHRSVQIREFVLVSELSNNTMTRFKDSFLPAENCCHMHVQSFMENILKSGAPSFPLIIINTGIPVWICISECILLLHIDGWFLISEMATYLYRKSFGQCGWPRGCCQGVQSWGKAAV